MKREAVDSLPIDDAAVVGGDDLIDAGDAHVAALQSAHKADSPDSAQYRKTLEARGFDTSRFQRPVLIRRRLNAMTSEERAGFRNDLREKNITTSELEAAYGPALARAVAGALPASVAQALQSVAADWHRLRLAAKQGAPWMEATPHLQAAVLAMAQARVQQRAAAELIFDGELAGTGFTEPAYGFLRLMHADAGLTQEADAAAIVERLTSCILTLETLGEGDGARSQAGERETAPGRTSAGFATAAEQAAIVVAQASHWAATPLLKTAQLSASTDFDALRQTRALKDLPASRLMQRWLVRAYNEPGDAARIGVIAEIWLQQVALVLERQQAAREDPLAVVDRILAVGHSVFALEALACLASRRAAAFDALDQALRSALTRHGIDAEVWKRIGAAVTAGMIDPTRLERGAIERLGAAIAQAPQPLFDLDREAFPVSSMAASFEAALRKAVSGPFAPLFPAALAMTTVAAFALQLKRRLRNESVLDLGKPGAWIAAFVQSGAARLIGDHLAGLGDAVDGFAHHNRDADLGRALARFLRGNVTGSPHWYARRGADRLLWNALQQARGRDIDAATARMDGRSRG